MNCLGKRTGTATDSGGTLTEYFGALGTPPTPGANALNQYAGIAKIPASGAATLYLYDGWNCIAEYTGATPAVSKTFLWGLDLSGSLQGAGGVGGLLSVSQGGSSFYPTFDGNGNVSEYLASDGEVAAHFEYDPFGNTVVDTDSADQFSYRFSTKPLDFETGLYYYAYRYYDPVTGRWSSRDPIEEMGGSNLYSFVGNSPTDGWDVLGEFRPLKGSESIVFDFQDKPCNVCCDKCKMTGNKPVIEDAGTNGTVVKARLVSPTFESVWKAGYIPNSGEDCCAGFIRWWACYTGRCVQHSGTNIEISIPPDPNAPAGRGLAVSVSGYAWCSCESGRWQCHTGVELDRLQSGPLGYELIDPKNMRKGWKFAAPKK